MSECLSTTASPTAHRALEITQSTGGRLALRNTEERLLDARIRTVDYLESEKILLTASDKVDPVQKIRVHLARGNLATAERLLEDLTVKDAAPDAETALERARLGAATGQWAAAVRMASSGLALDPSSITRLSLLQVRANALYELNEVPKAFADLETAAPLIGLYPEAPTAFYCEINRFKCEMVLNAPATAAKFVAWIDTRFVEKPPNLDQLLVLLRLRIEIARSLGENWNAQAIACVLLSQRMGDRLYESLGWVDLLLGGNPLLVGVADAALRARRGQFDRVDQLVDEVLLEKPTTLTARRMIALRADPAVVQGEWSLSARTVVLFDSRWKVDLPSGEVVRLSAQERTRSILRVFGRTPKLDKEAFFRMLWKLPRFDAERHDPLIRTAIKRVRRQSGVKVRSCEGSLSIEDALLA